MLSAALGVSPLPAAAQSADSFPTRPIKILVPYAPGGATDIIARIVAAKLTESLGQSVLVENRTGASGNLALEAVAKAPADGYTLLVGNVSTNTINENTFAQQLQSKPSRDLVGIAKLVEIPHIIAVTAGFPGNSFADLVAEAKRTPGRINYASAGLGSYPHLDMEKLQKAAGIQMTHIPYKGGAGQMIPSLISGETTVAFINLSSTLGHIRVDKLYSAVAAVLLRPEMKEGLAKQMQTVTLSSSPQEFTELVRKETQGWGEFLREANIKVE